MLRDLSACVLEADFAGALGLKTPNKKTPVLALPGPKRVFAGKNLLPIKPASFSRR
jgi:hypothetical protein